jgi:hypothetical protein
MLPAGALCTPLVRSHAQASPRSTGWLLSHVALQLAGAPQHQHVAHEHRHHQGRPWLGVAKLPQDGQVCVGVCRGEGRGGWGWRRARHFVPVYHGGAQWAYPSQRCVASAAQPCMAVHPGHTLLFTPSCPCTHPCRSKIALIQQFLSFEGITIVISDIDTVWMRNPLPFFSRYAQADILTSSGVHAACWAIAALPWHPSPFTPPPPPYPTFVLARRRASPQRDQGRAGALAAVSRRLQHRHHDVPPQQQGVCQ